MVVLFVGAPQETQLHFVTLAKPNCLFFLPLPFFFFSLKQTVHLPSTTTKKDNHKGYPFLLARRKRHIYAVATMPLSITFVRHMTGELRSHLLQLHFKTKRVRKKPLLFLLARRKRFELLTFGSVDRRSIQLSQRRKLTTCLELLDDYSFFSIA